MEIGLDWLHLHTFLFVIIYGSVQCSRAIQTQVFNCLLPFQFSIPSVFPHNYKKGPEVKYTKRNKTGKPLRMILHLKSAALDFQWHIDDTLKKWIGFF